MASALRRRRSHPPEELNVTAFMNLMVVLVPFLLLSAAFSQITIHDLNLPALTEQTAEPKDDKPKLVLEVVIRTDALDVLDRQTGRLQLIPNTDQGHDFAALRVKFREIKGQFPEVSSVTLLLEAETPYDVLIAAMDVARSDQSGEGAAAKTIELFPDVSIGDAPVLRTSGGAP